MPSRCASIASSRNNGCEIANPIYVQPQMTGLRVVRGGKVLRN